MASSPAPAPGTGPPLAPAPAPVPGAAPVGALVPAPAAAVAGFTTPANAALFSSARANIGNGNLTFGFLSKVDPGLPAEDHVVVPHGSTRTAFAERARGTADPDVTVRFIQCLCSDADTVAAACARRKIVAKLVPFVAANRAYSYAFGHLGEESRVGTVPHDEAFLTASTGAHPHIAQAVAIGPEVGTLAVWGTTVNYYNSNHNTTGSKLPASQLKAIRQVLALDTGVTDNQITSAVYLAGHAADKRLTLRSLLPPAEAAKLVTPLVYHPCTIADTDAWAAMRSGNNMSPAGTSVVGMLKVLLHEVGKGGFLGFAPAPEAVVCLENNVNLISANPAAYHPGATYLFGMGAITLNDIEDLKAYVGIFGGYAQAAGKCKSITSAPHIARLISENGDTQWTNLGKQVAKGMELDVAKINGAMQAYNLKSGTAVADPVTDATQFKTDHDALIARVNAVNI